MRKIISLFARNYDGDRLVRDEVVPGAEWVLAGEGVATRKWDGTCCLIRDGKLYKRFDAKAGKAPPPGFEPAQEPDPQSGHWPGWVPVGDGPEDRWHREAKVVVINGPGYEVADSPDGTYELCGPKVQGNPEQFGGHVLVRHGADHLPDAPRDFAGLKAYLAARDIEGIVWWRTPGDPGSELVKVKGKDFGIKRLRKS